MNYKTYIVGLLLLIFWLPFESHSNVSAQTVNPGAAAKIKVRFNGKLTTLDDVAKDFCFLVGEGTKFRDQKGELVSPLDIYLHTISLHPQFGFIRLMPVSEELAIELGLEVRANNRYSVEDLLAAQERFSEFSEAAFNKIDAEQTAIDKEIVEVARRFDILSSLRNGHASPWNMSQDNIIALGDLRDQIDSMAVPRMVPPNDANEKWRVLFPAAFDEFASGDLNVEGYPRHPISRTICTLLTAYADDDQEAFDEQLTIYFDEVKELEVDDDAFVFESPRGWRPIGADAPYLAQFYSDSFEQGVAICRFEKPNDNGVTTIIVNHFPGVEVSPQRIGNSWRVLAGLAPLSESEFASKIGEASIANHAGYALEFKTNPELPLPSTSTYVRMLHLDGSTWVFSMYGPAKETNQLVSDFQSFVDSIQIGDTIESWLALDEPEPVVPQRDFSLMGAVFAGKKHDWIATCFLPVNTTEEWREKVVDLIKELPSKERPDSETLMQAFEFDFPEDWIVEQSVDDKIDVLVPIEDLGLLMVQLQPIDHLSESAMEEFVRLRQLEFGAGEAGAQDAIATVRETEDDGVLFRWFDIVLEPADDDQ